MGTTIEIPEELIEKDMKLTGEKTKSRLITDALKEKIKMQRLLPFKGKFFLFK